MKRKGTSDISNFFEKKNASTAVEKQPGENEEEQVELGNELEEVDTSGTEHAVSATVPGPAGKVTEIK